MNMRKGAKSGFDCHIFDKTNGRQIWFCCHVINSRATSSPPPSMLRERPMVVVDGSC
jgi:hypothetical protein